MQFINAAITATEIALAITVLLPIAHTIGFVLFGDSRRTAPAPVVAIDLGPELEPEALLAEVERLVSKPVPAVAATAAQPVATLSIELSQLAPSDEPLELPNYEAMTSPQLRKECSKAGIQWRNARPDGKHLRKAEMVAALS